MILVHRLKGEPIFLNSDLVEYIESTPDTVITLLDGRRIMVQDAAQDVVDRVREFRAAVLVAAEESRSGMAQVLEYPRLVPDEDEE